MSKKSCYISFWSSWPDKWNVLLMTLLASFNTDTSTIALCDPKSYITHCLNHLNVMNTIVLLAMALASHDADASVSSVKWLKKSFCISFQSSWTNKQQCCWWCHQCHVMPVMASHDKNVLFPLVSTILTWETKWCYWQCCQCHMMLALVLTTSHDQKINVTPCFNCIHLMNKMKPLMMQLKSHGSSAGTNGSMFCLIWYDWQQHWHHKDMSRHCLNMSRYCLDM